MLRKYWIRLLMLVAIFASGTSLSGTAAAKFVANQITVDAKAEPKKAEALQTAGGNCEEQVKQIDMLQTKVNESNGDLEKVLKQCYNMTPDEYHKKQQCEDKPKPVKVYAPVVICVFPATKVGNDCVCDGVEIEGQKPEVVQIIPKKRPWAIYRTCMYNSEVEKAFNERFNNICNPLDKLVTPEQAQSAVAPSTNKCEQTGKVLMAMAVWSHDLRQYANDVPPLNRQSWEDIWNRAAKIWEMIQDHNRALCSLCSCKPLPNGETEKPSDACARFSKDLDDWRKKKDAKDVEHDDHLKLHDVQIAELQQVVGRGEWLVSGGIRYVTRMNSKVADSTQLRLSPGWGYWASQQLGFAINGVAGYAINKIENRYVFGAEFVGMYAFTQERKAIMKLGLSGDAEIVPKGTDAANLFFLLGFEGRPVPEFGIGVNFGLGPSFVTGPGTERRTMAMGSAGFAELRLTWVIPTGVKSTPPVTTTTTTTTTSSSESSKSE